MIYFCVLSANRMESKKKFRNIDEYISFFPAKKRNHLKVIRNAIKQAAPEAEELISYNMPAFKFYGILVYFAAHTNHIGFYLGHKFVNEIFKDKLLKYETSKGTIKFPFEKKLPLRLIEQIVKYKMKLNFERVKFKRGEKP